MCTNVHYPEAKLTLGACVRQHQCESLYFDITVGNVIGQARFILLSTPVMLTNNTYLWPYKCESFVCHTIF